MADCFVVFDNLRGKFVDCIIKLLFCMKYFAYCGFPNIFTDVLSRTSELNVNFSMFELTPRLLPTFKAWLLSTRSFCFNFIRRGSIPVSTVLRKSVRIFRIKKIDMYTFLIKVNCKLNLDKIPRPSQQLHQQL